MNDDLETIVIDVYPWPVPTEEQKLWFDALPVDEKRRLIAQAIEDGFASGSSGATVTDIADKVLARPRK